MNRTLLVTCLGLGVAVGLGVLHGRLNDAAPAPTPVPNAHAQESSEPAAAAPVQVAAMTQVPATSPEVARLDARRQLYESVDALVQASEFEKARKLLDEDQERYGDDLAPEWRDLEQSYRLIADCLEHPTPKLLVRAEAFVLVSQAVSLRPRIMAACRAVSARRPGAQ
ncbi:MAG: hypothetical protein ABUL60_34060 [Myxococcales bacterium]